VVREVLSAANSAVKSAKRSRNCGLPDERVSPAENPTSAPIREQLNLSYRILVVDDDNNTRQHSVAVLVRSGYDVETAIDGAAGWKALQTNDYDLVVTDNQMPKMTGIEMIARLRSAAIPVPIIMATGNLPADIFEQDPWLKPDAMLERPFSDEDLLATVKNVLHTPGVGAGGGETPFP
jgi:CheY-like chemotaxis protein